MIYVVAVDRECAARRPWRIENMFKYASAHHGIDTLAGLSDRHRPAQAGRRSGPAPPARTRAGPRPRADQVAALGTRSATGQPRAAATIAKYRAPLPDRAAAAALLGSGPAALGRIVVRPGPADVGQIVGERVDPVVRAGVFEHVLDPPVSSGGTFTVDGDDIDHCPRIRAPIRPSSYIATATLAPPLLGQDARHARSRGHPHCCRPVRSHHRRRK